MRWLLLVLLAGCSKPTPIICVTTDPAGIQACDRDCSKGDARACARLADHYGLPYDQMLADGETRHHEAPDPARATVYRRRACELGDKASCP